VYGVLLPLLVAGLLTGVVSALTSPWGLFRHGWVVKKLLLTLAAIAVGLAVVGPGTNWVRSAGLAVVLALLLLTTTLSVFKPRNRRVPA
jgi:phosphotransferase system  glucose/maltose/N-acetylglucosamine-specific IIC component